MSNPHGRPLEDGERRVLITRTAPYVKKSTAERIKRIKDATGLPAGRLIDQTIAFALDHPEFKLSTTGSRASLMQTCSS